MLKARRLEAKDLEVRVAWFNSPALHLQMPIEAPLSLAGTQRWFASNTLNEARRDFAFELDNSAPDSLVAMGGLVDIDHRNQRAELYVFVNPERTGSGFGANAVRWLCRYGFDTLNLNKIFLYTIDVNIRARRFYEGLGFVEEGVLRAHHFHNGRFVDRHIHGLLRDEWQQRMERDAV